MNLGPLGCVPLAKTLGGGIERGCYEEINEAAQLYNSKLSNEVASLQKQLPGIDFVIWDFYNSLLDILQHSTRYGMLVVFIFIYNFIYLFIYNILFI